MKKISFLLIASLVILSCKTEPKKSNKSGRNIVIGDTITTKSGLSYIFLKEGNGRKVEYGSRVKVYTDMYVNDIDTALWRTANDKDSVFSFVHTKGSLIKGFNEVHNYLVEGDEVTVIIPHHLAYGEKGRGDVPPNATLTYNPLVVKYVSEPKEMIADTLYIVTKEKGAKEALAFYEEVVNGEAANKYHMELSGLRTLFRNLDKDSLYADSEHIAKHFLATSDDIGLKQMFSGSLSRTLQQQGKYKEAIAIIEPLTKQERNKEYWTKVLADIKEKMKE